MDRAIFESYAGLEGRQLLEPILRDFAGKAAVVSSFGAESAVLLHMVSQVDRATPVIFIDTAKHFWETLSYRAKLIDRLGLTGVRIISPDEADLAAKDAGGTLHKTNADACCHIRKTVPLARALDGFEVTISGRKRYHGAARATLDFLSIANGRLKVEPLAGFSALDIAAYMKAHDLPAHPLTGVGYFSIGCEPCTAPGGTAADPRAGRWAGSAKTECGIHWTHNGESIAVPSRAAH
ncbi:MAG: phosphoadenylyl-sulfate reductase [Aestuariivirga sp.]|uniref:phosphoadenylyl-sulfate reductase n=1 Tax=Aestuariivirga sp. TaxID=2650926 RepID=UPI0025BCC51A|nr:phosphoadenylyl-sulfate reductase [Aestuariivirga sp.]MCA3560970.1 phosphoadenylyl-sulfate reductase [Aestuariivirga sp.]